VPRCRFRVCRYIPSFGATAVPSVTSVAASLLQTNAMSRYVGPDEHIKNLLRSFGRMFRCSSSTHGILPSPLILCPKFVLISQSEGWPQSKTLHSCFHQFLYCCKVSFRPFVYCSLMLSGRQYHLYHDFSFVRTKSFRTFTSGGRQVLKGL